MWGVTFFQHHLSKGTILALLFFFAPLSELIWWLVCMWVSFWTCSSVPLIFFLLCLITTCPDYCSFPVILEMSGVSPPASFFSNIMLTILGVLPLHIIFRGDGNGTPLQYSCLENPMDRGAWWAAVHGVAKSRTRLREFTFTFYFHALEKEMATHSSILAWRIPGTGKPAGQPSMGSHRVRHDWSDLAAAAAAAA